MMSALIAVAFHPLWVEYFVINCNMGVDGISVASFITNLLNFTLLYIMYMSQSDLMKTRVKFDHRMF